MHPVDSSRVVFFSIHDMGGTTQLRKGEAVLKHPIKSEYTDVNEVIELFNIKKYFDAGLFLSTWSSDELQLFQERVSCYGQVIGRFISCLDDTNIESFFNATNHNYISSFWELFNSQNVAKRVSNSVFQRILLQEPYLIKTVLTHPNVVSKYGLVLKDFLMANPKSGEILLLIYEIDDPYNRNKMLLPKCLTIEDKEFLISNYLSSSDVNLSYVKIIRNLKNRGDFKISDKTRLQAKRLYTKETERLQQGNELHNYTYGVSISFEENIANNKHGSMDNNVLYYSYSLDYVTNNTDLYTLFSNFKYLFEYLDHQNRISLVSNEKNLGIFERIMGVSAQNEYRGGIAFSVSEMTSQAQIATYSKVVNKLGTSLEDIVHYVFEESFREKYNFADNSKFSIPTAKTFLEKVRLLAPEFESALKQFKIFVEEGHIDFELLQISSSPSSIGDIPSLNEDKYIYLNNNNNILLQCLNLFFSDQRSLNYVEPFKEKGYSNFFDLLEKEKVKSGNYEEYQQPELNYLIDNGFIIIDENDFIIVTNPIRLIILSDLHDNDVGSYYHYPLEYRQEAQRMAAEGIVQFEKTLFSKPEQSYFNYCLNKSEFTNGLDLRNSYLHGTQASHDETNVHGNAYFTYLKLIFLALLKIEDDLNINTSMKSMTTPY
ncbi:hypothetical protein [Psychrobacter sanguinis]|uniref:hypothetical protein n=1 Tax=Psychrobacter sanguinis TaxID=861445 RepID=UPI00020C7A8D|nr:hypothetical protein [Psychrobacter sanguinis]EGK12697.1 hypothetical protein HMPREF9373_1479 [Psychrobacter sp. 1501(2011)]MCD9151821.1 hypothetical protein [Psychrobacter sanguinis]